MDNNDLNQTMICQSMKDFEIERKVGEGSYGSVFKARKRQSGEIVAIKQIMLKQNDRKNTENTLNEVRILASIDHENIVSYRAAF